MNAEAVTGPPVGNLIVTIDVEGDNAWDSPREISTRNSAFLPRFQELCEKHGLVPTYLTNYEMARDPAFVEFARAAITSGNAEIGMHLHAWNSPPLVPLTAEDFRYRPYLIDFPADMIRSKVEFMTRLLEDVFSVRIVSHRAGRWALNALYVQVLEEFGYKVDCSVTPHVDWRGSAGSPVGKGGTDYRGFPDRHYWIGGDDISEPTMSDLLEVPMTVMDTSPRPLARLAKSASPNPNLSTRALRRLWPLEWMRPNGHNRQSMLRVIDIAEREGRPYVEFMLHSSEFMPGGSPTFPDDASIERLYDDLAAVFEHAASRFAGSSLANFRETVRHRELAGA
jgi:hypothetical protein